MERVERVGCRKLDDVLLEFADDIEFYFLKIDAQGAEYEILKGAERLLSTHCLGLYPELFVIPLYKGITLLSEVERYLEQFSFRLIKKYPPHGSFDSQHDCLFLKEGPDNKIIKTIRRAYDL